MENFIQIGKTSINCRVFTEMTESEFISAFKTKLSGHNLPEIWAKYSVKSDENQQPIEKVRKPKKNRNRNNVG